MLDPVLTLSLCLPLAALLMHAAFGKLTARADFEAVLANYELLPAGSLRLVAFVLPLIEAASGAGLLLARSRTTAALVAALLFMAYALAIAINLGRGRRDLDCGCGGPSERRAIAPWMVVRNALLSAAALVGALGSTARELGALDGASIAGAALTFILLYLALDRLYTLASPHDRHGLGIDG